jgi:hypothetical protein
MEAAAEEPEAPAVRSAHADPHLVLQQRPRTDSMGAGREAGLWVPKPAPPGQVLCGTPSSSVTRTVPGGQVWFWSACDDLRLVGLKLIFLVVTRAVSVLGLSRREAWWKDAEILMLRPSARGGPARAADGSSEIDMAGPGVASPACRDAVGRALGRVAGTSVT